MPDVTFQIQDASDHLVSIGAADHLLPDNSYYQPVQFELVNCLIQHHTPAQWGSGLRSRSRRGRSFSHHN